MSKKILLIESDGTFAQELSAAIEARGLEARVTGDGKEGLDLAKADRPDLIVLCVELPKMSGYSVCNKLKKDDHLKSIPLVIISAEATPETFEQHKKLKTRAEDYLIKPFDAAALLKKIAALVELPPEADGASADDVVTLDDIELEGIGSEPLETSEPVEMAGAEDDDLKLLDEAFESLASEPAAAPPPPAARAAAGEASEAAELLPEDEELEAAPEIDRLGEEADAALAALGADDPGDADLAGMAALLDEPEPPPAPPPRAAIAPPAPRVLVPAPPPAAPADDRERDAELQRLQDRISELLIEVSRANEALERRGGELEHATTRLRALEKDLDQHRAGTRQLEERSHASAREADAAARAAEEALASAQEDTRRAEELVKSLEAEVREQAERTLREEQARHDAEDAAAAAVVRAREADARAAAAEQESAGLKLRLEEADQASSLKAAEAEQARERAEALARELDGVHTRASRHEEDLTALRPELEKTRADLATARAQVEGAAAEADRRSSELKQRVAELEAQIAKHEERVVKAYQKIKGDEKIREKTRKALAIALQLLEERVPGTAPAEVQPRRE
jgi:DNA-binding response OmpR family regulator